MIAHRRPTNHAAHRLFIDLEEVSLKLEVRAIAGKSSWAQLGDLRRSIHAAAGRAGEELAQYSARTRRRSLSSNVRYYLALRDFEPVGHVGLLSVGRTGMIVDLAVRPDLRGAGMGRTLIRRMVERSRGLGHDLTCIVYEDRPELHRLLKRAGFESSARFVSHVARVHAPRTQDKGASASAGEA